MLFLAAPEMPCIFAASKTYKTMIIVLLKFTNVKFDKTLIRVWVNFGKNLVPWNQGVMTGRKWGEKMINLTF